MKKNIFAFAMFVCLAVVTSITALAGTSSNYINGIKVTTTCNQQSSSHQINEPYGIGSAKISYTKNGVVYADQNVTGTSYPSYWLATKTLSVNEYAYNAKTIYMGQTVQAVYP